MATLRDVIERCRTPTASAGEGARRAVVVFDLDGTLFDNGPRTWQILVDFAESTLAGGQGPALRRSLDGLPRKNLPYLLTDTLARCGVDDAVIVERAQKFWRERFFTDDYQRFDEPLPGAVRFADELFRAGASLVYLSGRDAPNMLVGCVSSLRTHGFPVGIPRTAVVLKHAWEDTDLDFKREALHFMDELGDVAGTFDNEPANCNLFAARWPQAHHFFVETAHAPDPPSLLPVVRRIPDLTDNLAADPSGRSNEKTPNAS